MGELISLRGMLTLALTAVGLYLTFKDHKYGIIIFIILLFSRDAFLLRLFPPIYVDLHLPQVFAILTLILCFVRSRDSKIQLDPKFFLLFAFLVVILVSRIFADTPVFENKVPGEFFKMFVLFFLITSSIRNEKDLMQVFLVLVIVNAFSALYHYYYYKTGSWQSIYVLPKLGSLNRNGFALVLASMIPMSYSLSRMSDKKSLKILFIIYTIVFMMGTILTYSRSGFLCMVAGILAFIALDKNKLRNIFVILVIALAMSSRISDKYINRLETIQNYEEDNSAMGRVAVNKAAINMIRTHPVLGVGAGNFNSEFIEYVPYELLQWVSPGKSPHNVFLQVGSETGIIGLSIFSVFIIWCFIDLIKLRLKFMKHSPPIVSFQIVNSLLAGFFAYMVGQQFGQGGYYGYIYVFAPLITVAGKVIGEKIKSEERILALQRKQNNEQKVFEIQQELRESAEL